MDLNFQLFLCSQQQWSCKSGSMPSAQYNIPQEIPCGELWRLPRRKPRPCLTAHYACNQVLAPPSTMVFWSVPCFRAIWTWLQSDWNVCLHHKLSAMLNYQLDNILLYFSPCNRKKSEPCKKRGLPFSVCKALCSTNAGQNAFPCLTPIHQRHVPTMRLQTYREPHLLWRQRYAMVLAGFFSCQRSPCLETQPDSKYLCRVFQPKKRYLALVWLACIWWKSVGVLDWRASCLCPPCPRWRWGTAATKHSTETQACFNGVECLVPNLCNVGIPLKDCKVFRGGT